MKRRTAIWAAALLSAAFASAAHAQGGETAYTPSPENLEAREWFQDAKFGIFIHWGVYSIIGGAGEEGVAEWVMERKRIPADKYARLPAFFNPEEFDADEWVKAFKEAGARYVTITAKHHDGFAMYDSAVSDYDIVDSTPYGRDVIRQLKRACDRHGLKLFFYYSQLDWRHPDYYPRGRTGQSYTGRPESGDWDRYIDYQNDQLKELLTNYGDIGGVWFDGWWDQKLYPMRDRWRLSETYDLIHDLQPGALIGNNHHEAPFPGEDFQMFEQDLPGENTAGFNGQEISALPLEMAQTMNGSWGFNLIDGKFKSPETLVKMLVGAAGRNANFLMNTGPMPNGRLQPENLAAYKAIGAWMKVYGDSVYGTRGGPVAPQSWGVTTHRGADIFVHVLDWRGGGLFLPFDGEAGKATLLRTGALLVAQKVEGGYTIAIPETERGQWDIVIRLEGALKAAD